MGKVSLDRREIRILLLEGIAPSAVETFRAAGYTNLEQHRKALPEPELIERLREAYIVGIRSRTQLTPAVLAEAKKLIAVGCFCIGTNQVALEAAASAGVPVFNAPFSNTRSVAELVMAEIVLLMRGIPAKNALCHRGGWSKSAAGSREVRGKRLGIVGYGHIGTQVGILAEAFGMQVHYYDIEAKLALGGAQPVHSLAELLARSDVLTLHVPETPQTRNMIGAAELARLPAGAQLINASRGTVVDIDALAAALASGHVAGAAIDVFPAEPQGNDDEFVSPLRAFDQVLLTPHIGGSTEEAQENIGFEVAGKLVRYSDNGSTLSAVNFPEVSLPAHPGKRRLLHIHENRPGLLSAINDALSRQRINIAGQYLQTRGGIGYVVIDIDDDEHAGKLALKELRAIDGTLRTRILY
ncbi:phosphoglycerate dehydrogenase [Plasticicumulans sp.]|uniref:phosphoglycerate dehydrogenase n=1 Tax=Plasticicumulans sp. TaxID=2307179 RepID=UPI002CB6B9C4|nr:phosphoglycerate dehydrogenase [Plasticicumulans sp.]MBS0601869.1 phosphoglycerate dehydrogenase [Pseudomonadota bacterium]HMV39713.1 phosphoglycerate dehydrogenase [Plasticicumulans sp.]HMW28468.1 phosphoglycerate dehydrogenase [Plasticicumulans sp.]HMX54112.1 phosphoglycerate dehydrogenase [Plasticicumulans sp.]HMZ11543.1 phosphoglycerate dehydrogenase [Plasticicumulans sp.]